MSGKLLEEVNGTTGKEDADGGLIGDSTIDATGTADTSATSPPHSPQIFEIETYSSSPHVRMQVVYTHIAYFYLLPM